MNEKALRTLEYQKIIAKLEEHAATRGGKDMCRRLTPMTDVNAIRLALQEKPYALVGTIAGFALFVMLSPLIHYGIYGTT